jgi:cell wall-associated NlpC family hydrolase
LLATAKSLIGTPYVWGGDSPQVGGFDCSGFTKYVFSQTGYTINRTSQDQAKNGTYIAKENLQPGDLVFYSFTGDGVISHVGLYIGNGQMIHSPKTGDTVKITDITTSYWQSHYVTARRIIQ